MSSHFKPVPLSQHLEAVRRANQPQQRAKRPGQLPPSNRGRPRQRAADDTEAVEEDEILSFDALLEDDAEEDIQTGAWGLRVQHRNDSFQRNRPANTKRLQQYHALQQADDHSRQVQSAQEHISNRVKQAYLRHGCCILHAELEAEQQQQQQQQQPDEQQPTEVQVVQIISSRGVACHVLGCSFWQQVPTVKCSCCQSTWEVHPADVGFFSNSPDQPFVWFDTQLLQLYQHLLYMSGTSLSSFAEAMSLVAAVDANQAAQPATATNLLPMDPRQLEVAFQEWSRVAAYGLSPHTLAADALQALGPTRFCPPCAGTPGSADARAESASAVTPKHSAAHIFLDRGALSRDVLSVSEATATLSVGDVFAAGLLPGNRDDFLPVWDAKPRVTAVAFDANVKANRYRSAGRSGGWSSMGRIQHRFLDAANNKLWDMHAAGELPVSSSGSTTVADDLDLELDGQCHPRLSCARETSLTSGISDECGLAGCTCSHGIPIMGGFVAMPSPERFLFYDLLLEPLLAALDVDVMYLDTGCVYKKHFAACNPDSVPALKHIRVPWWHCRGHGSHCAPYNSGLYLTGAGRRVGENCEHLWAEIKPMTQLTRYMAKPNYLDCIDGGLTYVAESKLRDFVDTMMSQEKHARKKLEECSDRTQKLMATAVASGISRPQLAAATLQLSNKSSATGGAPTAAEVRDKLLVDYVRVHTQLQALLKLRKDAAALSVALPGSEGRNLHSHGQDKKRTDKLFKRLGSLATQLHLPAPLTESSAEYVKGLTLMRDEELCGLQQEIEKLVAGLQVLKFDRQQVGAASRVTRSQRRMATNKRKRVRQLVSVMQTWQLLQVPSSSVTAQLPANWTDTEIVQLFKGNYPWQQGHSTILGAVTKVMAERFRDACAEEARCIEELQLLKYERQRTLQYYAHVRDTCTQEAMVQLDKAESVLDDVKSRHRSNFTSGSSSDSGASLSTAGSQHLLEGYSQSLAQAVLLQRSAEQHSSWRTKALAAFATLRN